MKTVKGDAIQKNSIAIFIFIYGTPNNLNRCDGIALRENAPHLVCVQGYRCFYVGVRKEPKKKLRLWSNPSLLTISAVGPSPSKEILTFGEKNILRSWPVGITVRTRSLSFLVKVTRAGAAFGSTTFS